MKKIAARQEAKRTVLLDLDWTELLNVIKGIRAYERKNPEMKPAIWA